MIITSSRAKLLPLVLIFLVSVSRTQERVGDPDDSYPMGAVKTYLQLPARSTIGYLDRALYRTGDRTAVALLKILPKEKLLDSENIKRYLPILETAFSVPDEVQTPEDREPDVAFFVLNCKGCHETEHQRRAKGWGTRTGRCRFEFPKLEQETLTEMKQLRREVQYRRSRLSAAPAKGSETKEK